VLDEKVHWAREVFIEDQRMSRVTLTVPLINKARHILFLAAGDEKSDILKTVLTAPRRPDRYPAQMIRPERGEVTWFVDDKAASRLPRVSIPRFRRSG
jgi:6-phosphogluconolactonase